MGFLDKVKNMFIEEVEEDEPIKKEVIQVKIPTAAKNVEEDSENLEDLILKQKINDKSEEDVEVEKPVYKTREEKNANIPTFFDDDDFADFEPVKEEPKPKIIKKEYEYTKKETVIKPVITGYTGKSSIDPRKNFKPTPIISPVYGVLDKNYRKDEITSKKKSTISSTVSNDGNIISVDDIRNKAFGSLEDVLGNNLEDNNEKANLDDLIFKDAPEDIKEETIEEIEESLKKEEDELAPLNIFEELEKTETKKKERTLDDLLNSYNFDNYPKLDDEIEEENELEEDDEPLLDSELDDELDIDEDSHENDEDEIEANKNSDDLFNMIDAMYEKERDEDE